MLPLLLLLLLLSHFCLDMCSFATYGRYTAKAKMAGECNSSGGECNSIGGRWSVVGSMFDGLGTWELLGSG